MVRLGQFFAAWAAIASTTLPSMPVLAQPVETYSQPISVPTTGRSTFDASLRCMDDLLARSEYASGVSIYVQPLEKEESVNAGTRELIISALSRMSERSRAFKVYSGLTNEDLQTMDKDALVVGGSIAVYDKGVGSKGTNIGIGVDSVGLGYRNQKLDSVISTTMYLQDKSGAVIPLTTKSVSMALQSKNAGGDLSGFMGLFGGFLGLDFSRSDGPMQAVRALIDVSLIQSIGSWAEVPFARCLTLAETDAAGVREARRAFEKLKSKKQLQAIAAALSSRGLYQGSALTEALTPELRQAIADFQIAQQMPPLGKPTFEVYYALYRDQFGVPAAPPVPTIENARDPNLLGLRVTPSGANFQAYSGGEYAIEADYRASFSVNAARSAYVTCYYTDSELNTTRIFPNPNRPQDFVPRGESVQLPGQQDIYTIEPQMVGSAEYITCLGSSAPIEKATLGPLGVDLMPGVQPLKVSDARTLAGMLARLPLPDRSIFQFEYFVICKDKNQNPQTNLERCNQ